MRMALLQLLQLVYQFSTNSTSDHWNESPNLPSQLHHCWRLSQRKKNERIIHVASKKQHYIIRYQDNHWQCSISISTTVVNQRVNIGSVQLSGFPRILESTWIFMPKFKALKVLENRTGAEKSLNFIPKVLWKSLNSPCQTARYQQLH